MTEEELNKAIDEAESELQVRKTQLTQAEKKLVEVKNDFNKAERRYKALKQARVTLRLEKLISPGPKKVFKEQ